jgi:hypothetical protein
MKAKQRVVPRPFEMHWGKGQIVEEATCDTPYHEPAIQLLEYEDGSRSIRFCYFDHSGRFQRSPLILSVDTIVGLRRSVAKTPRIRALLRSLAG